MLLQIINKSLIHIDILVDRVIIEYHSVCNRHLIFLTANAEFVSLCKGKYDMIDRSALLNPGNRDYLTVPDRIESRICHHCADFLTPVRNMYQKRHSCTCQRRRSLCGSPAE